MQFSFDVNSVEKNDRNYDPIPAGWYDAQVTDSSVEMTKNGDGRYIKLRMDVVSENYRGRVIWVRLNVQHPNQTAERIAQQQLRELCEAIGLQRMTDTSQLHNKPVSIKVKVRIDPNGVYDPSNEVSAFKAIGTMAPPASASRGFPSAPPRTAPPSAPTPAPQSQPAPAPQADGAPAAPPWARRAA